MRNVELSIVSTIYNDKDIIKELISEIEKYVKPMHISYEIILVDDYSKDGGRDEIKKICKINKKIKGILLRKNHGQQIAMSVGINNSHGKYIVILDGDLQNPPSEIPNLYKEIKKGFDLVYTVSNTRNNTQNELSSKIFWFILSKLLKVKIVPNQLMMKIATREIVDRYRKYNETRRVVEDIFRDITSNYSVLKIKNKKRKNGRSHYSFFDRFYLMLDLVVLLTTKPLDYMIVLGLLIFFSSLVLSLIKIYLYFFDEVPMGYTSIVLLVSMFNSVIIALLGVIGKYLSNIYIEVKGRPFSQIQERINF